VKAASRVLEALARLYEKSKAGRTGLGELDFQPKFEDVLIAAGCTEGDARELADRELRTLDGDLLTLEFAHQRTRNDIFKIRLPLGKEAALYKRLGRPSPTEMRAKWSALFYEAVNWPVPEHLCDDWKNFCLRCSVHAVHWEYMSSFRREELEVGRDLLNLITKLLAWPQRDHFVRAVSCRLCGDSKRLERQRGVLERLLAEATNGRIASFAALGILDTPRHVLVAGPLRLRFADHTLDLGPLRDGASLSEADLERADIECSATRCVTVENKTSFHQRAVQHPDDLHLHTSYPGAATLALLRKLPRTMEFLHSGDTDPAGFDILRDLRQSTGLPFRSLAMDVASSDVGPALTAEEITLLQNMLVNPLMHPERQALECLMNSKRKGAFEQEHR
jgi:hypothetical protein